MEKKRVGFWSKICCVLFFAVFCAGWILCQKTVVKADTTEGLWKYRDVEGGVSIVQYTGDMPVVDIPASFNGKKVVALGNSAFYGKKNMHTVRIPATVRKIDDGYTYGCFLNCESLMLVEGLEHVTYIGAQAFLDCKALESVTFGGGLTKIGKSAFKNCPLTQECFNFPASLTEIRDEAFYNSSRVASVTIPAGVKLLGRRAFQNCKSLEQADIRVSGEVKEGAFRGCDLLRTVTVASSTHTIGNNAFSEDVALSGVTLSEGVRTLGADVFSGCVSLTSIHTPKSLRTMGESAFSGCTSLRDVTLERGLLEISRSCFRSCGAIEQVVVPTSVSRIWDRAFEDCSSLSHITIPNSVREFESSRYNPVFGDRQQVLIYGYEGSKAEEYAGTHDNLTFEKLDAVPSIQIVPATESVKMKLDETRQIAYTVTPANTTDAILWSSSNSSIVSVNGIGEITANRSGSVTITMETTSGLLAYLNVEVEEEPTRVSFNLYSKTINVGQKITEKAVVRDRNGVRYDIVPTYSSSNPSIASVDANGTVTGLKEGTVTITARVKNLTGSYRVKVVNASLNNNGGNGSGNNNNQNGGGSSVGSKSIGKIKISAKGKVLTVKTIKGASVKVSAKRSILGKSSKTVKANSKGTAKIKFKKKIKKVTVTVKVTKSGYLAKTQKKKFK